ncbi:hypothetical protein ATCCBAA256_06300 [Mycobacterium montefiorense]|nr:hypothetical protein ATCCBAA256_06300 [Mycobacterium montefiorense]
MRGRLDHTQFLMGQLRQPGAVAEQWSPRTQLARQQFHPLVFGQRAVVGVHAGPCQQLGDHFLVYVRVLPHIQATQVKPEDVHALSQQAQPILGQHRAAVRAQRGVDDVEVGPQFVRRGVRRETKVEQVQRFGVQDLRGGHAEPTANHPHRPPVGLVGPGLLGAAALQLRQFGCDSD